MELYFIFQLCLPNTFKATMAFVKSRFRLITFKLSLKRTLYEVRCTTMLMTTIQWDLQLVHTSNLNLIYNLKSNYIFFLYFV